MNITTGLTQVEVEQRLQTFGPNRLLKPVTLELWGQLLLIALTLIVVDELHKYWHNRKLGFKHIA